jgi:hypothetical protein
LKEEKGLLCKRSRVAADNQRKLGLSPRIPIPRRKSNPNPIVPDEFPPTSHPRIHIMGSNGTSITAGRVSLSPVLQEVADDQSTTSSIWSMAEFESYLG